MGGLSKTGINVGIATTATILTAWVVTQLLTRGPCDEFKGTDGPTAFDVEKYKGTWYELRRDKENNFE